MNEIQQQRQQLYLHNHHLQKVLQMSMKIVMKFAMLTVLLFSFDLEFGHCVNTVKFFIFY